VWNSLYVLFTLKFLYDFRFSIRCVVNARSVEKFGLGRTHKYKTKNIQGGQKSVETRSLFELKFNTGIQGFIDCSKFPTCPLSTSKHFLSLSITPECTVPLFYLRVASSHSGLGPAHYRGFTIIVRHITLCRTPLD